ncbi:MAG: hypothetical protein AAGB22_15395, partial [Bacteroidota bacterium]
RLPALRPFQWLHRLRCWSAALLLLCCLAGPLQGQEMYDRMSLHAQTTVLSYEDLEPVVSFGLRTNLQPSRYFGFEIQANIGQDYFDIGPGVLFLPFFLGGEDVDYWMEFTFDSWYGLLLPLMAFENFSLHIPTASGLELSPYVSLARLRYITQETELLPTDDFFLSGSIGLRANNRFGNVLLAPFAEVSMLYTDQQQLGLNFGFSIGFYARDRY